MMDAKQLLSKVQAMLILLESAQCKNADEIKEIVEYYKNMNSIFEGGKLNGI